MYNFADFVLFGLNQTGGKRGALFVAQFGAVFSFVCDGLCLFERFDFFCVEFGSFFCFMCFGIELLAGNFGRFRSASCKEPTWQGTTRTPGSGRIARQHAATTRLTVLRKVGLGVIGNLLFDGSYRCGSRGPVAEFR